MKKISIIIPAHNPNPVLLKKLQGYLKENINPKTTEVLLIDGKNGLANAYNNGIKQSKGEIIITIHSDCLPLEKDSLDKMIKPFQEDPSVVMTYPWILDKETNRKYYPIPPDGKLNAFRKKALERVGLFREDIYLTGGEDFDIYLRLKKIGKLAQVETGFLHDHPGYFGNLTLEKQKQNGSINGALFRIWGFQNPKWFKSFLMCFRYPLSYGKYFIKAFIRKKQDYRRKN